MSVLIIPNRSGDETMDPITLLHPSATSLDANEQLHDTEGTVPGLSTDFCGHDLPSDDCLPTSYEIPQKLFEPLYDNSTTTTCGAFFSIMHFAIKNKLSYTAIGDLLSLLNLLCPKPNNIPSSFFKFKKFFQQFSSSYTRTNYCVDCEAELEGDSCVNEDCTGTGGLGHLIQIPIKKSLQAIISSK
jgi:hypothetical protein